MTVHDTAVTHGTDTLGPVRTPEREHTMARTARLAVARHFGSPEVIALEAHPSPDLRTGQIRVAVRSSGINPLDARIRSGSFGGSTPLTLGTEYAGVIIESTDPAYPVGTAVLGWGAQGANSDLVITDASRIMAKPTDLDWDTAAGIGGVGSTALTALDALTTQPGNTIVVHGAAGGVGTLLTQLARTRGLTVIGTASTANHAHLRTLGAHPVTYGPGLTERITAAAGPHTVAASIDLAGSPEAGAYAATLREQGGQAITLVPETASSHGIPLIRNQRSRAQMVELLKALSDGALQAPTESVPFTHIVEAHRRIDAAHGRGKLVLDLSDNPHLPAQA